MRIGGITPVTTIDYPGYLSCVVFVQGCPLKCRFCHNKHLAKAGGGLYDEKYLMDFLEERKGFCDAVVISGGEPYSQPDILEVMLKTREMGYKVGVHTSGFYKERFIETFPVLDWVGFDAKCLFHEYEVLTGVDCGSIVRESLTALLKSGVDYEVRTTVDPYYFTTEKLLSLAKDLSGMHVGKYVLQEYRDIKEGEKHIFFNQIATGDALNEIGSMFKHFDVRRAHE